MVSCTREYINLSDLNIKGNNNYEIVIEGVALNFFGKQFVSLHRPAEPNNLVFKPISNAVIQLYDGKETYAYIESETLGDYYTADSIACKAGKLYTLSVYYNGKLYTATDSMEEVYIGENEMIPSDTVYYDILGRVNIRYTRHNYGFPERSVWQFVNGQGDGTFWEMNPKRLYFGHSRIYAHTVAPLQGIMSGGYGNGSAGHEDELVEYYKFSISENYYRYLLSVFSETDWADNTFSSQPGNTLTNVSEGGTGFFYASDMKKTTKTLGEVMRHYE